MSTLLYTIQIHFNTRAEKEYVQCTRLSDRFFFVIFDVYKYMKIYTHT